MNGKELMQTMLRLLFPIWGAIFIAGVAIMFVLGYTFIGFSHITLLIVIAPLMTLSTVVHYSKKELSKNQIIVRYVLHAMITLTIMVVCLSVFWSNFEWSYLFLIVPFHLMAHCIIVAIDEVYTKRLLSKFREVSK